MRLSVCFATTEPGTSSEPLAVDNGLAVLVGPAECEVAEEHEVGAAMAGPGAVLACAVSLLALSTSSKASARARKALESRSVIAGLQKRLERTRRRRIQEMKLRSGFLDKRSRCI